MYLLTYFCTQRICCAPYAIRKAEVEFLFLKLKFEHGDIKNNQGVNWELKYDRYEFNYKIQSLEVYRTLFRMERFNTHADISPCQFDQA